MRKKHPIRRFFAFLFLAALVAGLAALPMLTASKAADKNAASILSGKAERRDLTRSFVSGGPLETVEATEVSLPSGVKILEFLVTSGEQVKAGQPIARVDDVSVMTAVKQVQESLDSVGASLQTVRSKITPGVITVDDAGTLRVDGKAIPDDKLPSYAQFITLSQQHRDYAQLMLELFLMHRSGVVTAPCDGLVGDLDETMIWKLSASGAGRLVFLSAVTEEAPEDPIAEPEQTDPVITEPEETEPIMTEPEQTDPVITEPEQTEPEETDPIITEPEETEPEETEPEETEPEETPQTVYRCFVRAITAIREDGMWVTRKGTSFFTVTDLEAPAGIDRELSEAEEVISPDSPVLYCAAGTWQVITPAAGDLLLYAEDEAGACWIVKVGTIALPDPGPKPTDPTDPTKPTDPTDPGQRPTDPTDPTKPTDPTDPGQRPSDPTDPTRPGDPTDPGQRPGDATDPTKPADPTDPTQPSIPGQTGGGMPSGGIPSGGMASGDFGSLFGSGGGRGAATAAAPSLYSLEKSCLCTVTPMERMRVTLSVDEMDIRDLEIGMTAELTFEALRDRKFTAEITDISQFGANSGGSSKFDVTLELPCAEGMLPGMNAGVTVELEVIRDCLTIPVAALVEQGNKSLVYTGFDEKNRTLTEPVPVEPGYSDGEYVQLLSGLKEDDGFWYAYYDTVEISNAVEKKSMFG